jgi:hypothetical protein
MKKLLLLMGVFVVVLSLSACSDLCIGVECITGETNTDDPINDEPTDDEPTDDEPTDDEPVCDEPEEIEGLLSFIHINGEGVETERPLFVLFEYESRDFVKYQISYLSCTCRNANVNYWQVAYVEVNKNDGSIRTISFNADGEDGHYTAGMWGDSSPTPAGHTLQDFEERFIPWLIGKTLADFEGISVFTNNSYHGVVENTSTIAEQDLIDDFAGSSVSTNNLIRSMTRLLEYHNENY